MASVLPDQFPRKFGGYHLLGPLAQGGMGALYLAVNGDRGLERLMVVKTILPHLADSEYTARFRDEAKVVVRLSHGNLINVFDAGQQDGELYLAMDFIEGRDLRAVWNRCAKKQVAFPIDIAVYIAKELCRALHYVHTVTDLGLVHRDVSPPNVLLSFTGEVKLTDFGLAASRIKLEKTAPGIVYGKVAYMSPEQARGESLDGRSDLYAAAIVLWELLTGRQLFPPSKNQPQDLLGRAKATEPPPPSERAPRVPPELDQIVLRALEPKREDRYESCEEFRVALQSWLATNAPTTDTTRIAKFVYDLFVEDIEVERAAREELILSVRQRALTLPPTDELRQLVERSSKAALPRPERPSDAESRDAARRQADRGDAAADRRRYGERRASSNPAQEGEFQPQVLDGRYRLVQPLGEGGMGKVFLAEHVEIGKKVAVKILHPTYSRMPDLVERFRREARAASRIGHPHIVDVTDSGTTPAGAVYFVMEYLEGEDLGSLLGRERTIEETRALRIIAQICRALAAAHGQGIVHRDLKPENVFLTRRDGHAEFVKVLDFGIAKTAEAEAAREKKLTSPGMAMGTPEYMSPEQAAGLPADARSDIYAVGAIMYEMVSGRAPYTGENFMEVLAKKATSEPQLLASLRPDVTPEVVRLVERAMAREPDKRPATMLELEAEVMAAMRRLGGDRRSVPPPVTSADSTSLTETALPAKPLWKILVPAALVLVAGASFWLLRGSDGAPTKAVAPAKPIVIDARRPVDAAPPIDAKPTPIVDAKSPVLARRDAAVPALARPVSPSAPPVAAPSAGGVPEPTSANEAGVYLDKANLLLDQGSHVKALAIYQAVAGGNFRTGEAWLGVAKVQFAQGKYAAAGQSAQSALVNGAPKKTGLLLQLRAFEKAKQWQPALTAANNLLRIEPMQAEAVTARGRIAAACPTCK